MNTERHFDSYIANMRLAISERDRVASYNRKLPIKQRRTHRKVLRSDHKAVFSFEADAKRTLKKRTPDQWAAQIKRVQPNALRGRVAKLIWWDYFGHRISAERWPHLDAYLAEDFVEVSERALQIALYQCGYTPWMAMMRVESYTEKQEAA